MMKPLDAWFSMSRAGLDMAESWLRLSETVSASTRVADRRGGMLGDAARSPLTGDYVEFARMIPEKLAAFSQSGAAWWGDCLEVQRQMLAQAADNAVFAASGGANPTAFAARGADRAHRVTTTAMRAGGKALAPVHRAATGNAKRLKV